MSIEQYIAYLMSEQVASNCVKASNVLEVSYDEVSRLLNRPYYSGNDLFFMKTSSSLDS